MVSVAEAKDGTDALRVIAQQEHRGLHFDCIFMDCLMPVMDGPTAAKVSLTSCRESRIEQRIIIQREERRLGRRG